MKNAAIERLRSRVGTFPIELPAAALLALATAFLIAIAPDWRLESLVRSTGLGAVVPAAEPPLGQTARLLLALLAASAAFLAAWQLLRALDRKPAPPAGFPAFRKADLHPDAPMRRPILAGEEFGTPDEEFLLNKPLIDEPADFRDPLPSFLAPPASIHDSAENHGSEVGEGAAAEGAASFDPVVVPAVEAEPAPPDVDPFRQVDEQVDDEVAEQPAWPQSLQAPASGTVEPLRAIKPRRGARQVAVAPAGESSNVTDLMSRLETGISKRGGAPVWPIEGPETKAALREALDDLNRTLGRSA